MDLREILLIVAGLNCGGLLLGLWAIFILGQIVRELKRPREKVNSE